MLCRTAWGAIFCQKGHFIYLAIYFYFMSCNQKLFFNTRVLAPMCFFSFFVAKLDVTECGVFIDTKVLPVVWVTHATIFRAQSFGRTIWDLLRVVL